ncbi:hypothetical protein BURMUCGD2M_6022 [Burkholderia multivorans CGD2M]|uniref:Uncharacterized protein n=1 Tax=Burkholderia multivorans CGD2 TaxID=513052 RepID=B9BLS5_9BURK|nr:hypothetical protein BURMUCGD2_6032 [Burkholderia multivorans CGD2]EEE16578.1 hypothetical protein BURMUCGD2M_6022 [Burkholderia multivorans CGD2M]
MAGGCCRARQPESRAAAGAAGKAGAAGRRHAARRIARRPPRQP